MNLDKKIKLLAKNMNEMSTMHLPILPSIVKCFKLNFNEKQIDELLLVDPKKKYKLEELDFICKEDLEHLFNRGAIWRREYEDGIYYELAPIFPGFIEITLSSEMDDLRYQIMEEFEHFEEFLVKANIKPIRALMNHKHLMKAELKEAHMSTFVNLKPQSVKLDLNYDLNSKQEVISSKEVKDLLIKNKDHLALMYCYCRVKEKHFGHECKFKMSDKTCINVGTFADSMVEYGISERIDLKRAFEIVDEASKKGAIHTVYHYNNNAENEEIVVCNCCMDCCSLYGLFNKGSLSNILVKAYYLPNIYNEANCIGCNSCGRYCPTSATYYDKETKKLVMDNSKCIGCGQCALKCKFNVRDMVKDERVVFVKSLTKKRF